MKNYIKEHVIGTQYGRKLILDWVKDHKFRNYPCFEGEQQNKILIESMEIEDKKAREIICELVRVAQRLNETNAEMHREMDTIGAALEKISNSIDSDLNNEKK